MVARLEESLGRALGWLDCEPSSWSPTVFAVWQEERRFECDKVLVEQVRSRAVRQEGPPRLNGCLPKESTLSGEVAVEVAGAATD